MDVDLPMQPAGDLFGEVEERIGVGITHDQDVDIGGWRTRLALVSRGPRAVDICLPYAIEARQRLGEQRHRAEGSGYEIAQRVKQRRVRAGPDEATASQSPIGQDATIDQPDNLSQNRRSGHREVGGQLGDGVLAFRVQEHECEQLALQLRSQYRKQTRQHFHWTQDIMRPAKVTLRNRIDADPHVGHLAVEPASWSVLLGAIQPA
ncbi:hypothetical protein [Embleya sp. AB8]|uniref:hypothetical protein n=1 Tax=Embleya sp. AB8 TaxID=3156304 RepID=UPI003C783DF0